MPDPPCEVSTHAGSAAAYAVLTHVPLLSLITGFQRGLPGLVAPLVHRYEAEGWMERTIHVGWERSIHPGSDGSSIVLKRIACVVSRASGEIWPPRQWQERCALEAGAAYDSSEAGFPVLRRLIELTATRLPHERAHVYRCICDAAATVGRVDVLQWVHITYSGVSESGLERYALAAMHHRHEPVLEWIKTTFGTDTLTRVIGSRLREGEKMWIHASILLASTVRQPDTRVARRRQHHEEQAARTHAEHCAFQSSLRWCRRCTRVLFRWACLPKPTGAPVMGGGIHGSDVP